jgi:hypothetical protein
MPASFSHSCSLHLSLSPVLLYGYYSYFRLLYHSDLLAFLLPFHLSTVDGGVVLLTSWISMLERGAFTFDSLLDRLWFGIGLSIVLYDFWRRGESRYRWVVEMSSKTSQDYSFKIFAEKLHLTCIFYTLKVDWHHLNHSIWFIERLQRLRHNRTRSTSLALI